MKDAIAAAKGKCFSKQVEKIKLINSYPKDSWKRVKMLMEGLTRCCDTTRIINFKDYNGKIASADAHNAKIVGEYFSKVLNK